MDKRRDAEWRTVRAYLSEPSEGIRYIFVPFVQASAMRSVLEGSQSPTVVVTRWNAHDLASGVSDPRAFLVAQQNGWVLRHHPKLHMKVYSWGLEEAIVGSANLTSLGLGIDTAGNEEYLTAPFPLPPHRQVQLARVLAESIVIDQNAYETAVTWAARNKVEAEITEPLVLPSSDRKFLTSSLPLSASPAALLSALAHWATPRWGEIEPEVRACALHDAIQLGLDKGLNDLSEVTIHDIRRAYFGLPFIQAIDRQLVPSLQFGSLKAWIQHNCTDVPVPSRRDLTGRVQVLMRWFVDLDPSLYRVDVPGRWSQRLTKLRAE